MGVEKLTDICMQLLRINFDDVTAYTEEHISSIINDAKKLYNEEDSTWEKVVDLLRTKIWIHLDKGTELIDANTFKPWLSDERAGIDFYYWGRYRKFLLEEKLWNQHVVNSLDKVSDDILELIGNPKQEGTWGRRGLLLGDVQSGKTSNYLSLCNKAADAGFKIIILLTGTIESLRKQTQQRVDEGFTGRNSKDQLSRTPISRLVGVGLKGSSSRCAIPFTSIDFDFNATLLRQLNLGFQDLKEPAILVVKKNKTVLQNLEKWLSKWCREQNDEKISHPLFLIDDESDNASVNTKDETTPAAINKCIRDILHIFSRSTYLAVTATPFANIFINPFDDESNPDLFPKDFIYALSCPSNYIGANEIFGENGKFSNTIEIIDDAEDYFKLGHKKNTVVNGIPVSLKKAILYFCISNTIRDLRNNSNKHRSMLINVSRYTDVQNQVYENVLAYFIKIREDIQNYCGVENSESDNKTMMDLKSIFDMYSFNKAYDWHELKAVIYESISPIKIMQINQRSNDKSLEYNLYENGLRVIAIGGDSLSRGLTLEGLSSSYFYRNSQMYDTLMQMGRWFGYRDNYEDIFRIWLPEAGVEWYEHITDASNELREDIKYMQRANLTPNDFGLKVRNHQDSLLITARNKMKFTHEIVRPVSLNGRLLETPRLLFSEKAINDNFISASKFLNVLSKFKKSEDKNLVCWYDVPKELISEYVSGFAVHPSNIVLQPGFVGEYIQEYENFPKWDVAVPMGDGKVLEIAGNSIKTALRNIVVDGSCMIISGKHARVGSNDCAKYCLDESKRKEAEEKYKFVKGETRTYPSHAYLRVERKPLLIINLIDIKDDSESFEILKPLTEKSSIVSISVGVPDASGENAYKTLNYVANLIEMANILNYDYNEEEDEDDVDQ